jgi:hypothetical protein
MAGGGWTMSARDARGGTIMPMSTAARIWIRRNTVTLIAPASELGTTMPPYRVTAFRHTGDYGIDPPHDWSGDVEPTVAQGLAPFTPTP